MMTDFADISSGLQKTEEAELVFVHLDFLDGSQCKLLLPTVVVQRLQDGDNNLMESLREQYISNANENTVKRQLSCSSKDAANIKRRKLEEPSTSKVDSEQGYKVEETEESFVPSESVPYMEGDVIDATYFQEVHAETDAAIGGIVPDPPFNIAEVKQETKDTIKEPKRKRKKGLKRYMKYSLEDRDEAVRLVTTGFMSQQDASKKYNIPQATLSDAIRTGSGMSYKCETCGRQFSLKVHFSKHCKTHKKKKDFLCDNCGLRTTDKTSLVSHVLNKHPEICYSKDVCRNRRNCNFPQKHLWTDSITKMLFKEYENCYSRVNRNGLKKGNIWKEMSEAFKENHGVEINSQEICTKWKSLMKSYRSFKKSGESRRSFKHLADIEEFLTKMQGKYVELSEENEGTTVDKSAITWTREMTELLLEEYKSRYEKFADPLFKKKTLWEEILIVFIRKGFIINALQLENKWKVLVRSFKMYEGSDNELQEKQDYFPFYEHISEIFDLKRKFQGLSKNGSLDETPIVQKEAQVWSDEVTNVFFDQFRCLLQKVQYSHVQKISLWQEISRILCQKGWMFTASQVETKWRILLRSWKRFMEQKMSITSSEKIPVGVILVHELIQSFPYLHPHYADNAKEDVTSCSQSIVDASAFIWSPVTEKLLLNDYKVLDDKCGPLSVKKKVFWQKMCQSFAAKGYITTPYKLLNKWKALKKSYAMSNTNSTTKPFPYLEEMKELLKNKDENCHNNPDVVGCSTWSHDTVMLFLTKYQIQKSDDTISCGKGKKMKQIWQNISNELSVSGYKFTAAQCENKMKCLMRSYRAFKEGHLTLENQIKQQPFLAKIAELMGESIDFETVMQKRTDKNVWTKDHITLLIDEYGARLDQFDNQDKSHGFLWSEIEATFMAVGYEFTATEIKEKWNKLVEKYRTMLDSVGNENSSKKRKEIVKKFPYYEQMEELLGVFINRHNEEKSAKSENNCKVSTDAENTVTVVESIAMQKENVKQNNDRMFLSENISDDDDSFSVDTHIENIMDNFHNQEIEVQSQVNPESNLNRIEQKEISSKSNALSQILSESSTSVIGHDDLNSLTHVISMKIDNEQVVSVKDKTSKDHHKDLGKLELLSEVVKSLKLFEVTRMELECQQLKEVTQINDRKLSQAYSVDELLNYIDEYETQRMEFLKQRMDEIAQKHKQKINVLKNLLKCEKLTDAIS